jgi:hypothetical protein
VRSLFVLIALAGTAHAEVRVGAAVGAGGQGPATYSAIDVRLDAEWEPLRIGLGVRGVWLDGVFRRTDWARAADAVRAVRLVELAGSAGSAQLAIAAGGLAPAQLAHVADGYRAALDDRQRTGVRGAVTTPTFALGLEVDDVLEPGFVGGAVEWQLAPRLVTHTAIAIDPIAGEAALELAAARRWARERSRVDAGGGIVGEPGFGIAALTFVSAAIDHRKMRWTASGELRAGTGSIGAAFGPLHRVEPIYEHSQRGIGGAVSAGVAGRAGWLRAGLRARPGLGGLATVMAGAPMGRWVQAGMWLAASRDHAAGAGELRVAWARRLASALELARMQMYDVQAMQPRPLWSATAWFSVASD